MESTSQLTASQPSSDIMGASNHHDFLKLEDLHSSTPPPHDDTFDDDEDDASQDSPAPVVVQSKPAKKRKSWGQELPEPKTTLPPRKRAKTDDEKEQRRIERIKRNRAAAHNSRERKRQETETLAVALARANAKLEAYEKLHGPLPSNVVLPEVTLSTDGVSTPAPSLIESRGSVDAAASPASPNDTLFDHPVDIKQEPTDQTFPTILPPAFDNLDSKPSMLSLPDQTQHSAAMLCDLQCRSSSRSSSKNPTPASLLTNTWWTTLFLALMTHNLRTCYSTILTAIWSLSPSRMARLTQASARRLTSRSTTSSTTRLPSWSTIALAQRNAATGLVTRQGALALQRRSLIQARRARTTAAAEQQHPRVPFDDKALGNQHQHQLQGDRPAESEGDDHGGVGR